MINEDLSSTYNCKEIEVNLNDTIDPKSVYLTDIQVAERLTISKSTVWRWKDEGKLPKAVRIGPNVTRWRLSDILEFEAKMEACFVTHVDFSGLELKLK